MGEKVTVMVLKVDLQCPCCYKKVKKILCKFPQIRDQVYNEKENTVTITVVCCNPEKVRDKLCCKGAKVIKSIEIKDPPKRKEPEKQQEKPKEKPPPPVEKPKEQEKPKEKPPPPAEKPKEQEKPKEKPPPPAEKAAPPKEPAAAPKPPPPVNGCPPVFPVRTCCGPCYEGVGGGPCYHGYGHGVPPPPQPCFDGYYYGYGPDKPCHVISRCDYYFSEENPQSCSIM